MRVTSRTTFKTAMLACVSVDSASVRANGSPDDGAAWEMTADPAVWWSSEERHATNRFAPSESLRSFVPGSRIEELADAESAEPQLSADMKAILAHVLHGAGSTNSYSQGQMERVAAVAVRSSLLEDVRVMAYGPTQC